jgi:hypothetical protein
VRTQSFNDGHIECPAQQDDDSDGYPATSGCTGKPRHLSKNSFLTKRSVLGTHAFFLCADKLLVVVVDEIPPSIEGIVQTSTLTQGSQ